MLSGVQITTFGCNAITVRTGRISNSVNIIILFVFISFFPFITFIYFNIFYDY